MPVISLPDSLKTKNLDNNAIQEIAEESLGRSLKDENDISCLLDNLDITVEDTLLEIGSLARNSKVDSVRLSSNRTLLELRGLIGKDRGTQVNNGVVVVIKDEKSVPEEVQQIFYPQEQPVRSITLVNKNNE